MKNGHPKLLAEWAVFLFSGILLFQFLHECGHGCGSKLEGYHVSTGFNRVGDIGKRPSDPEFRSNTIIQGRWNTADFLGPLINWIFAIIFTTIFLQQKNVGGIVLLIGSGAVINALMRLFPMVVFFVSALQGRLILEDEVALGLSAVRELHFPMSYFTLKNLVSAQPALFLSASKIYFWPAVSLLISLICFICTYLHLNQLALRHMIPRKCRYLILAMPFVTWPLVSVVSNKFDNLFRISW